MDRRLALARGHDTGEAIVNECKKGKKREKKMKKRLKHVSFLPVAIENIMVSQLHPP